MVEPEIIQRRVKGNARRIIALIAVAQLGRDEHLACHAGGLERVTDSAFVVIGGGCVNMTVADLQRLFNGLLRGRGGDLEDSESDLRNRNGIGERNARDIRDCSGSSMFHNHSFAWNVP